MKCAKIYKTHYSNTMMSTFTKSKKNAFLLVRHGESIWNQDSKFTGWTNIPLTDVGRDDARNMAESMIYHKIIPNIIFSSVLERAVETSTIIQKKIEKKLLTDVAPIYTSWRLNERHYGKLEGIPRKHVRESFGDKYTQILRTNYHIKPPNIVDYACKNEYSIFRNCYYKKIQNGESKEDVMNRLLPYYENDILYTLSENKFPLIVTHKHTARVLMKHLLNMTVEEFEDYELPRQQILHIELDENMVYQNHTCFPF